MIKSNAFVDVMSKCIKKAAVKQMSNAVCLTDTDTTDRRDD